MWRSQSRRVLNALVGLLALSRAVNDRLSAGLGGDSDLHVLGLVTNQTNLSRIVALHEAMSRCPQSPRTFNILVLGGSETSGVGCFCKWRTPDHHFRMERALSVKEHQCQPREARVGGGFFNGSGISHLVPGRGRCPWAERVRVALRAQYPSCEFDVYNAALGGTSNQYNPNSTGSSP